MSTLNDLLEIFVEGPLVPEWWRECHTTRRVNQRPRKQCRVQKKDDAESQSDDKSSDEEFDLEQWDKWFRPVIMDNDIDDIEVVPESD